MKNLNKKLISLPALVAVMLLVGVGIVGAQAKSVQELHTEAVEDIVTALQGFAVGEGYYPLENIDTLANLGYLNNDLAAASLRGDFSINKYKVEQRVVGTDETQEPQEDVLNEEAAQPSEDAAGVTEAQVEPEEPQSDPNQEDQIAAEDEIVQAEVNEDSIAPSAEEASEVEQVKETATSDVIESSTESDQPAAKEVQLEGPPAQDTQNTPVVAEEYFKISLYQCQDRVGVFVESSALRGIKDQDIAWWKNNGCNVQGLNLPALSHFRITDSDLLLLEPAL